jgi:hypothetical protein
LFLGLFTIVAISDLAEWRLSDLAERQLELLSAAVSAPGLASEPERLRSGARLGVRSVRRLVGGLRRL